MRGYSDPGGPGVAVEAPGRANLIGEHTDYNDGFVLPVALELRTAISGRRSDRLRLESEGHAGVASVDLRTGRGPTRGWARYVTAVVRVLREEGLPLAGVDGRITSSVPVGTGLSSSAALEVAVALAVLVEPIDAVRLARLCQRAENEHVGVRSGILDQLASAGSRAGSALFIDCRSLDTVDVTVPEHLRILVMDSGERRSLSGGEYNRRRAECEEAARRLGVASLREVGEDDLVGLDLPEPFAGRVRHVVSENARVVGARAALRSGDEEALRALFAASHASLARDFGVSTPRLDALVDAAADIDGVVGARMTGAGFGGCIVALVHADAADRSAATIGERYRAATGHEARAWVSRPAAGALELRDGSGSASS